MFSHSGTIESSECLQLTRIRQYIVMVVLLWLSCNDDHSHLVLPPNMAHAAVERPRVLVWCMYAFYGLCSAFKLAN